MQQIGCGGVSSPNQPARLMHRSERRMRRRGTENRNLQSLENLRFSPPVQPSFPSHAACFYVWPAPRVLPSAPPITRDTVRVDSVTRYLGASSRPPAMPCSAGVTVGDDRLRRPAPAAGRRGGDTVCSYAPPPKYTADGKRNARQRSRFRRPWRARCPTGTPPYVQQQPAFLRTHANARR